MIFDMLLANKPGASIHVSWLHFQRHSGSRYQRRALIAFVHPGILHTRADLDRIKTQVVASGVRTVKSGLREVQQKARYADALTASFRSPFENLIRNPQKSDRQERDRS